MASAVALARIDLASGTYAPGETIEGLTEADLEDLKGFIRVTSDEVVKAVPIMLIQGTESDAFLDPEGGLVPGSTEVAPETPEDEEGDEPRDRIADVKAAIDLLEADDFTASGRPKVSALSSVLGYKPEADEVNAALALREAEGQ